MGNPITKTAMTEDEVLASIPKDRPALRLVDRCDRCGVQAFVAAHHATHSTLLFCGHHFAKHEAALIGSGFDIQDERSKINEKPSISANAE